MYLFCLFVCSLFTPSVAPAVNVSVTVRFGAVLSYWCAGLWRQSAVPPGLPGLTPSLLRWEQIYTQARIHDEPAATLTTHLCSSDVPSSVIAIHKLQSIVKVWCQPSLPKHMTVCVRPMPAGVKGNLTENRGYILANLIVTGITIVLTVYFLAWQTYVMRADVIISSVLLVAYGLDGVLALSTLARLARLVPLSLICLNVTNHDVTWLHGSINKLFCFFLSLVWKKLCFFSA